ncbi:hypothetical protein M2454_000116 [Aequitasia blattaphilus]|uniref:hypothetical protein n=1 Tax=Aequitasia blattaphilus TaxID=2949332 RepID=UPI0029165BCB|nr:hypothetical protein [Aequitasia blattaphilus]
MLLWLVGVKYVCGYCGEVRKWILQQKIRINHYKITVREVQMVKKETKLIMTDYPEYENIRKTILNAKEDVVTTVNFAMVTAYWKDDLRSTGWQQSRIRKATYQIYS